AALAELKQRFGFDVWYAGPDEKARYARQLAEHCDVPLDVVQAAVQQPVGWPGAPGANRNVLLLHTAGEAFLSLDDDMGCRLGRLPAGAEGLSLTSSGDPTEWWFYASPKAALAAIPPVDEDLLALHESLLGTNVGRLASAWRGSGHLDLNELSNNFLDNMQ